MPFVILLHLKMNFTSDCSSEAMWSKRALLDSIENRFKTKSDSFISCRDNFSRSLWESGVGKDWSRLKLYCSYSTTVSATAGPWFEETWRMQPLVTYKPRGAFYLRWKTALALWVSRQRSQPSARSGWGCHLCSGTCGADLTAHRLWKRQWDKCSGKQAICSEQSLLNNSLLEQQVIYLQTKEYGMKQSWVKTALWTKS